MALLAKLKPSSIRSTGPVSVAVVMGAEGRGIRRLTRQTCDGLFAIPMLGGRK